MEYVFAVIGGGTNLHRGKKTLYELVPLVGYVLPYAVRNAYRAFFKLYHGNGNAVHIHNKVRPLYRIVIYCNLFRNIEIIFLRLFPVYKVDCLRRLAGMFRKFKAVFKYAVCRFVCVVGAL